MISEHQSGPGVPTPDFSFDEDARDRLAEVIRIIGTTVRAGEIAGVTDEQIRRWRDGKAKPNFASIAALTYAAGKSLDWLATGRDKQEAHLNNHLQVTDEDIPGFTLVPRLDIEASAGPGALAHNEQAIDYLAFQESWLRARKINPSFARVLTAKGDSMEPTIRNGDVLLVDTSINYIQDNTIYVIVYGDILLVKRVHSRLNGTLQLISDNPLYPPEEVTAGEIEQLHVAGRVMWFGRSI